MIWCKRRTAYKDFLTLHLSGIILLVTYLGPLSNVLGHHVFGIYWHIFYHCLYTFDSEMNLQNPKFMNHRIMLHCKCTSVRFMIVRLEEEILQTRLRKMCF